METDDAVESAVPPSDSAVAAAAADMGPSLALLEQAFDSLVEEGEGSDNDDNDNDAPVGKSPVAVAAAVRGSAPSDALVSEESVYEVAAAAGNASSSRVAATFVEGGRIRIADDEDDFMVTTESFKEQMTSRVNTNTNTSSREDDSAEKKKISEQSEQDTTCNKEDTASTTTAEASKAAASATSAFNDSTSTPDDHDDNDKEKEEDEDVRKAVAMAELMQTHPHLSPEELSKRASELVGDSQKKLLPPPKKSMLEEALSSKQGQGLMAALKETGILQSVPSSDSASHIAAATTSSKHHTDGTSPTPERPERPNVLAGFKNVQESFRQQQNKVTKNLKDFGLILEKIPDGSPGKDQDHERGGMAERQSAVTAAPAVSPGAISAAGSTDFGGGSPATISRTTVSAATTAAAAVATTTISSRSDSSNVSTSSAVSPKPQTQSTNMKELTNVTPSIVKSSSVNIDERDMLKGPPMPVLDTAADQARRKSVAISSTKPAQTSNQSATPASFQATQQGPMAIPKLFAAKGETQGFSLNEPGATLFSMVWKRRSGLGQLQKNAWERRRLVLREGIVCYFKGDEEKNPALSHQNSGREILASGSRSPTDSTDAAASVATAGHDSSGSKRQSWWEQATINIQKQAAELTQQVATTIAEGNLPGAQPADPNAPRGVLDIVKERATFAATAGHSGAPSPFCISMKVRGETRWKFAFETRSEQMKWLAALTDVVVKMCVGEYNNGLKMAESTTSLGAKGGGATTLHHARGDGPAQSDVERQVAAQNPALQSSIPNINVGGFLPAASAASLYSFPPDGKNKLWRLGAYSIEGCAESEDNDSDEDETSDIGEDVVDEDDEKNTDQASEEKGMVKILGGIFLHSYFQRYAPSARLGDKWMLKGDPLYLALTLLNWAIFYGRRSSTSIARFWFVIIAINVVVCMCLKKADTSHVSSVDGEEIIKEEKERKRRKKRKAEEAVSVPALPVIKPRAGSTLVRVKNAEERPTNKAGHRFCGFRSLPSSEFHVRSHGYLSTKKKIPCPGELYTLAAMDVFESDKQYRDMAKRVKLPPTSFKEDGEKTWHSPDIFVVSVALPTEAPKLGRPTEDGQGFTITMYFTMKQLTRDILKRVTIPGYDPLQDKSEANTDVQKRLCNGVRLWEEWCRRAPSDPSFQARFKFIPFGSNLVDIGMPGWISKYNGKPVLIKRAGVTGFLFDHPELNAMGFDITLHPFPYLAKQATAYMADAYFKQMIASFAFVIEGRSDDELPEVLIGQGSQGERIELIPVPVLRTTLAE